MTNILILLIIGLILLPLVYCIIVNLYDEDNTIIFTVKLSLGLTLLIIGFMLIFVPTLRKTHEDEKNSCENVGGNYEIVDNSFTGKVWVDIYGCVKK